MINKQVARRIALIYLHWVIEPIALLLVILGLAYFVPQVPVDPLVGIGLNPDSAAIVSVSAPILGPLLLGAALWFFLKRQRNRKRSAQS